MQQKETPLPVVAEEVEQGCLGWARLAPEVQLRVLEILFHDRCTIRPRPSHNEREGHNELRASHNPLATYASVCCDWQQFFQMITFSSLHIRPQDIPALYKLRDCHRSLVDVISLYIEVSAFPIDELDPADPTTVLRWNKVHVANSYTIKNAMADLWAVLKAWKDPSQSALNSGGRSMTIELGVFPSYTSSNDQHCRADDAALGVASPWWSRCVPPRRSADIQPFPHLAPNNLIFANEVKQLRIRRQNHFGIWGPALARILHSLPGLETVWIEFWRRITIPVQTLFDNDFATMVPRQLPKGLTKLVIFEDFSEAEDEEAMLYLGEIGFSSIRPPSQSVAQSLASCRDLRSLSISFIIDAKDFFEATYQHPEAWQHLTKLSLTSILLRPTSQHHEIDTLLLVTANAVLKMPKLELLELWYGRKGQACLFRYRACRDGTTEITRAATWDLHALPTTVGKAWADAGYLHTGRVLNVTEPDLIDSRLIRTHGDAIYHLGLENQVVDPVSLDQIRAAGHDEL